MSALKFDVDDAVVLRDGGDVPVGSIGFPSSSVALAQHVYHRWLSPIATLPDWNGLPVARLGRIGPGPRS